MPAKSKKGQPGTHRPGDSLRNLALPCPAHCSGKPQEAHPLVFPRAGRRPAAAAAAVTGEHEERVCLTERIQPTSHPCHHCRSGGTPRGTPRAQPGAGHDRSQGCTCGAPARHTKATSASSCFHKQPQLQMFHMAPMSTVKSRGPESSHWGREPWLHVLGSNPGWAHREDS